MKKFCFISFILLASYNGFTQSNAEQFLFNRGNERARFQDYRGAMEDFSKIIEVNPKNESAYNNRGMLKVKMHDLKGALEDFIKATNLRPDFGHAFYNKGLTELNLGFKESADADLNKALQLGYDKANEAIQMVSYKP